MGELRAPDLIPAAAAPGPRPRLDARMRYIAWSFAAAAGTTFGGLAWLGAGVLRELLHDD